MSVRETSGEEMAYNLYHVQMAKAWCERVNKENALQERSQAAAALRGVRVYARITYCCT